MKSIFLGFFLLSITQGFSLPSHDSLHTIGNIICVSSSESYEILSLLGKGEKAEVYLAKDVNDKEVAIKRMLAKEQLIGNVPLEVLDSLFGKDGTYLNALQELHLSQQLNHPNIVKIYKYFLNQDIDGYVHTYLVMEWIDGKNLRDVPSRTHSREKALLNANRVIEVFKLATANQLFHQDLYGNILMVDSLDDIKFINLARFVNWPIHSHHALTHEQYFEDMIFLLLYILTCGDFSYEELNHFHLKMLEHMNHERYASWMSEKMGPSSYTFVLSWLEELTF